MKFKRIYVEISNVCNLQCSFCPEVGRDKKVMSREAFLQLLPKIAPWTEEVCLHLMGEPLAHPEFREIVEACAAFSLPINLTTNGTLLTRKSNSAVLLNPIIRQVNFSVQSYFGSPRHGVTLTDYLGPIFRWTHLARRQRPDLYVNYRFWLMDDEASPVGQTGTRAAPAPLDPLTPTGPSNLIMALIEREFGVNLNRRIHLGFRKSKRVVDRIYLHFDSEFRWPHESDAEPVREGTCYGLRHHIGVHADGTVVPCCLDKEAQLKLGDLGAQTLEEILGAPRASAIRAGFERGELVESLCQRCTYVRRFTRSGAIR
jgi:hypothetical protein